MKVNVSIAFNFSYIMPMGHNVPMIGYYIFPCEVKYVSELCHKEVAKQWGEYLKDNYKEVCKAIAPEGSMPEYGMYAIMEVLSYSVTSRVND